METEPEPFKPPYMSFQTFWNFIGELASKPVPPRIDRSLMNSKSGTDQANLTNALTAFGLVDSTGVVQPRLRQLAATDDEGRKPILAAMVREYYPKAVAVSEANDTEAALNEAFRDEYGLNAAETRRKCVTFFLHALRLAELPVSAHFKQTRPGSGAPGTPRLKRTAGRKRGVTTPNGVEGTSDQPPAPAPKGDTYTVELGSGGSVSVVVSVDLFALTTDDRNFIIELVDKLKGYPKAAPPQKEADTS